MSIISWNCRGLGLPPNVRFLKELVRQERPSYIFLCETIDNKGKIDWISRSLGFDGLITVDAQGRSDGLALLWKEKEEVELRSFSRNHIDVEVAVEGKDRWRLTGFYGEPNRSQRRKTWDLLRNLARDSNLPWCVIGDMNNLISQVDKRGGALYPNWLIEGFNEVIVDTNLIDMELVGYQYTWERGKGTADWIEERLDRALINPAWLDLFPMAKLYNLEDTSSDHCPIMLITEEKIKSTGKRPFRFENAWLTDPMCHQLVLESWEENNVVNIQQKVKLCGDNLEQWGREVTGRFGDRIKKCKLKMSKLRKLRDGNSVTMYKKAREELFLILEQREIFWRQRSKQLWLHSGDKNSKYFHVSASARRRTNQINRLRNNDGVWTDWEGGLAEVITAHFNQLFTATQSNWSEVVEYVERSVTEAQNVELLKQVYEAEVKEALFQMNPDKAPGPDGMTPAFYQKHWAIVGKDIVGMVRKFFEDGVMPTDLNMTNVVLIPKKKSPTGLGDLRPIVV